MEIRERINELENQLNELKASLKAEEQDNRPITERVKTFEDALEVLGEEHPLVNQWWDFEAMTDGAEETRDNADLIALYKLRVITAALNEGWEPRFTEDEWRYYPWFTLYTQEEWGELEEEEKQCGVLFGGLAYGGAFAGFVSAYSSYSPSIASANVGSRLCFKSDALARYAGRQFAALYADFYLIRK